MTAKRYVLCVLMIPSIIKSSASVESVERNIWEGVPCAGLQNELTRHRNVVACRATWVGDIASGASDICRGEWEICNQEYNRVLREISWYEATHISGCYAVNASHGSSGCVPCGVKSEGRLAEMAAIGADCPTYQRSSVSCFGIGRIHASDSRFPDYKPCNHVPWITGVLCCRKGSQYPEVKAYMQITPSPVVLSGTEFKLQCHVTGIDSVQYRWYHNHSHIRLLDNLPAVTMNASTSDSGTWKCEAIYGHRTSESRAIFLRVIEWSADIDASGCKNKSGGKMLASTNGKVALCRGNWVGHVKSASSMLCAKGWKVCTNKERPALYSVLWQEVEKIQGCFAYDAASTKYFPCSKCSPRNKGNRMAGIGNNCANLQSSGYSCLGKGRMDVYGSWGLSESGKNLRSCHHQEGITTGVACCKKTKKPKEKGRCRCRNGGKCSRKGQCNCPSGFHGKRCQKRVLRSRRDA